VRRSWHLIAALRGALRTDQNVRFALLFGSTARGTDTPTSDVDVLVELRDPDLERIIDLEERLTAASGRLVEIVRLDDVANNASLLGEVLTEGRVLVDRDKVWPTLRSRERTVRGRRRDDERRRAEAALAGIDRLLGS
jgi:predicted nucleotidyltransferase